MKNKRGMEAWIIVAIVLAIVFFVVILSGLVILQGKGVSAIDFITRLFKFGGSDG